jgi:hypothetical protein
MTLDELRTALDGMKHLPGDTQIILQKDAEGNAYSPLDGLDETMYLPETAWSGEAHMTDEQIQAQITANPDSKWNLEKDRAPEGSVPAVVLWPVN